MSLASVKSSKFFHSSTFLIVTACLLLMFSFGYRSGFGLFLSPISEDNGWSRDIMSFSLALQNLVWGVVAVFAGGLADRYGNVRVVLGGVVLYSLGMYLMSVTDSIWMLHTSAGLIVGSGIAGTAYGIVLPAMARAVGEERRQWALGLGTAAGSMGQFLVVPISFQLMDSYGWVMALQIMAASGIIMALLAIPLAPYSGAHDTSVKGPTQGVWDALKEAMRHHSFLLLVAGFYVCGFQLAFVTVHMPAYLVDLGFGPEVGAWAIALIGLCNVVGSYLSGYLSGRFPKREALVVIYVARAIATTVFLLLPITLTSVLIFSAVLGFFWLATVPPTSGLVAVMFGTRYMAMLYGIVFLGHQLGSFTGVWLGGYLYEATGSYDPVWWISVLLALLAALAHWPIKERPVARLQGV
ncbi:MFS transporter [Kiloniella antarctica]|uniref:MFS transporter n=1 Tax=Kiloniella antarctica TaxID=1550907 RepID=A0ABW5BI16_9PROT